jgi:5S rRNA maturation endonuclease (ribonuclease M5)
MQANQIKQLLGLLDVDQIEEGDEWVRGACPFGWSRHSSGRDSRPSFGVTIDTGASHFNCFACNTKGTVDTLLVELMHDASTHGPSPRHVQLIAAFDFLEEQRLAGFVAPKEDWEAYRIHTPETEFEPWPAWWLEEFAPVEEIPAARSYLAQRRQPVSSAWARRWDLRWDSRKQAVVAPFWNRDGYLAGARGRGVQGRYHHDYKWNLVSNTAHVWYGEHFTTTAEPVVLVEGQFDAINVSRCYRNVMANLSTGLSAIKLEQLIYYPRVVVFFDNDMAGAKAAHLVGEALQHSVGVEIVRYKRESFKDPGAMLLGVLQEHLRAHVTLDIPRI